MLPVIGGYWERAEFPREQMKRLGELRLVGDGIEGDGQVTGFLVEKGAPGLEARRIEGKVSVRAVWQVDLRLTDVRVPADFT